MCVGLNHCGKVGSTLRKGDAEMGHESQPWQAIRAAVGRASMATRKGTLYYSSSLSYDAVPQVVLLKPTELST